jgi:trk system potassium uptake protein TrkH
MKTFEDFPFFVILMGLSCVVMYIPMMHAIRLEDWLTARTFFYNATLLSILTAIVGIATRRQAKGASASAHLLTMLGAYAILPLLLAMPMVQLVKSITFFQAYFEMLSCLTTTGASLFGDPKSISEPLHLWRALVGWLGGFMILVVAMAIFAPLNMGGFEIYALQRHRKAAVSQMQRAEVSERLNRFSVQIFPIYLLLTIVLSLVLIILSERVLVAVCHAMSVLSTSGISPIGGLINARGGFAVEAVMFMFLFFAASRNTFLSGREQDSWQSLRHDKEITQTLFCITLIPLLLFIRHWFASIQLGDQPDNLSAIASLWGGVFNVMSFLTTTGFVSKSWEASQYWSGLNTPGLIFIGLACLGGGVATTAGGIKLLRIYALYKHGLREMERLSYPHSVGGAGQRGRSIRREGAFVAWIFLMVFALTLAIIMLALTLTGIDFITALAFAASGFTTTGPLVHIALENKASYAQLSDVAKGILCVAMILGRLETVAVIALFNPNYWR